YLDRAREELQAMTSFGVAIQARSRSKCCSNARAGPDLGRFPPNKLNFVPILYNKRENTGRLRVREMGFRFARGTSIVDFDRFQSTCNMEYNFATVLRRAREKAMQWRLPKLGRSTLTRRFSSARENSRPG